MSPADDEPGRAFEHADLVSELTSHDLALAAALRDPGDRSVFEVDPDADPDAVFPQSVASGGPTPEGVILWTRVAPDAFDPAEPLAVEVAGDADFEDLAFRGIVDDDERIEAHDHTVTVDLDGALEPDTRYRYRFVYDGTASRTGRCRTLPAPDASPESLSFAVLTCQNYRNGYYGALAHVAREDVDFVVHVGDYVYESDGAFRGLASPNLPDREIDLPSGHDRAWNLDDYRYLYRTYRSDRHLKRVHEAHTFVAAWDDHEIANDVHWDYEADAPTADHPKGDDPAFMTRLTADAIHAWWEYMPARVSYDPESASLHGRFELWRSFAFGDLVDLVMTDERLFRSKPGDYGWIPTRRSTAPEREDPPRTMLGRQQREWLLEEFRTVEATWTVWCDEVLTIPLRFGVGPASVYPVQGGWDGYKRERREIMAAMREAEVPNFIGLTGDMHSYIAGYQVLDDPGPIAARLNGPDPDNRVGVEFMTPSVTSLNVVEAIGLARTPLAGPASRLLSWLVTANNPHIEYFDSSRWGYSTVEFTREDCTWVGYAVDKTDDAADADKELVRAFRVPEGKVELEDVTEEYRE